MRFNELKSANDIVSLVQKIGFLPFFANDIKGFSIEEHCPQELWFANDVDGPWEWKGPIARGRKMCLRKILRRKGRVCQFGVVSRSYKLSQERLRF